MPENTSDNREYYKDELYNVVTYYKVLLIPQKEGKFTINPLSINMLAEVGTGQYDYWGDEITRTTQLTVSSPAETITVRPLPRARPSGGFQRRRRTIYDECFVVETGSKHRRIIHTVHRYKRYWQYIADKTAGA